MHVRNLFLDILYREPTKEELVFHGTEAKSFEEKKNEILSCHERLLNHQSIIKNVGKSPLKIALMLIGHFRRFDDRTAKTWSNFKTLHPDVDIFVHTWNEKGLRSCCDWIQIDDEKPDFESINDILKPVTFIREDHTKYLENFGLIKKYGKTVYLAKGQKVQKHDDFSKFIASQLYSIYTCYQAVKKYSEESGTEYDIVIKLRADTVLYHPLVFKEPLPENVLYIHSRSHFHRDGGRGCKQCDVEWTSGKRQHYNHVNDVCDVLNYGNMRVMEKYCCMYKHLEELIDLFDKDNKDSLSKNPELNEFVTRDGKITYFGWCGDMEKNLKLTYPERLIREYMRDYWLLSDPYYL